MNVGLVSRDLSSAAIASSLQSCVQRLEHDLVRRSYLVAFLLIVVLLSLFLVYLSDSELSKERIVNEKHGYSL